MKRIVVEEITRNGAIFSLYPSGLIQQVGYVKEYGASSTPTNTRAKGIAAASRQGSNGSADDPTITSIRNPQNIDYNRPRWANRLDRSLTPMDFLVIHYGSEIDAGQLVIRQLRKDDIQLYRALMNWRVRHEVPSKLQGLFGPRAETVRDMHLTAAMRVASVRRRHGSSLLSGDRNRSQMSASTLSDSALADIRGAVNAIKAELPFLTRSNSSKAEITADINQIEAETERPAPRRRFMKQYLESLRDNLAKAAGAATAAGVVALVALVGGLLAKHFGLL